MANFFRKIFLIKSDFEFIFFVNEYRALVGRNYRTILTLAGITFITFLALGFAIGSLENLRSKMANPFTNWVNLPIFSNRVSEYSKEIMARYNDPSLNAQFQVRGSSGFTRFEVEFYEKQFSPFAHPSDTLSFHAFGRTIGEEETLLQEILDPNGENVLWADEEIYDEEGSVIWDDCRVVISAKLLKMLGYKEPRDIKYIGVKEERTGLRSDFVSKELWVPLRVVAVVRNLPSAEFISSPELYNTLKDKRYDISKRCRERVFQENRDGDSQFMILVKNKDAASNLSSFANEFFKEKRPSVDIDREFTSGDKNWVGCRLSFTPVDAPTLDSLALFLRESPENIPLAEYGTLDCGGEVCTDIDPKDLGNLSFHFNRLEKIKAFRDDLDTMFRVEIDMSQVESKENFALVTNLTYAISFILLVLGILSMVMFVNNLLKTHLYEIRSNLGTFQAFGLSDAFILNAYLKIVFSVVVISIFFAFLFGALIDRLEQMGLQNESKFNLFNIWTFYAAIGLLIVSLFISIRTIRRILWDTPGNLIYKR